MTQPCQDDADSQQEPEEKAEIQSPRHGPTKPAPRQADDGAVSAGKTDNKITDEIVDKAVNKEVDAQAEEGDDSPTGRDQDSDSTPTDEPTDDTPHTDTEDTTNIDAEALDDTDAETVDETDTPSTSPSTKRRRSPVSTRQHRRSLGQTVSRGIGVSISFALAVAAGGVTWWGYTAPTIPTPQLQALNLAQSGDTATYVYPHAPINTLQGTGVGAMESATAIVPAEGDGVGKSAAYTDRSIPADTTTSMNTTESDVLTPVSADGRMANVIGAVMTLTKSGGLQGLTVAPCTQPFVIPQIVGGSIAAGSSAEPRLVNPGATPATTKVTLYGSIDRFNLSSNGEIIMLAGGSSSLVLETKNGQDSRIVVPVEVDGGSVVSTPVAKPLDGETPTGTDAITPGATPATDLVVLGVEIAEPVTQGGMPDIKTGADSPDNPAVRIVNPDAAPTAMSVIMLGKDGARPLSGAQSVTIDAGSVFDIQLAGAPTSTYGMQVASNTLVGATTRMIHSSGEYPARSRTLVHDQARAQATLPGAADSGPPAASRAASLSSAVIVTNSGEIISVILSSPDGFQKRGAKAARGSSSVVEVSAKVSVVHLSAAGRRGSPGTLHTPSGLAAATVVAAQAGGDLADTLVFTMSTQSDAVVQAQRRVLLD